MTQIKYFCGLYHGVAVHRSQPLPAETTGGLSQKVVRLYGPLPNRKQVKTGESQDTLLAARRSLMDYPHN